MGATKVVTDATFDEEVLKSDKPVIVDYWAEWCGPCRMVAPVLEEIASENAEKIQVVKLNIDENPTVAQKYGIMAIPTMNVFSGGQVVKQIVGAKPKSAMLKELGRVPLEFQRPALGSRGPASAALIRVLVTAARYRGVTLGGHPPDPPSAAYGAPSAPLLHVRGPRVHRC